MNNLIQHNLRLCEKYLEATLNFLNIKLLEDNVIGDVLSTSLNATFKYEKTDFVGKPLTDLETRLIRLDCSLNCGWTKPYAKCLTDIVHHTNAEEIGEDFLPTEHPIFMLLGMPMKDLSTWIPFGRVTASLCLTEQIRLVTKKKIAYQDTRVIVVYRDNKFVYDVIKVLSEREPRTYFDQFNNHESFNKDFDLESWNPKNPTFH